MAVLVIGSGIAGLSFALKLASSLPNQKVKVLTKSESGETNTRYAQGGIAAVTDIGKDSFDKHIQDTIVAGSKLSKLDVVDMVIKEGPHAIKELKEWGVSFDKKGDDLDLHIEGGHSEHRIAHHKDTTGMAIQEALLMSCNSFPNVEILSNYFATDLYLEEQVCKGVYAICKKTNRYLLLKSEVVVLASGGMGQLYRYTTNPLIATGDGIAMAARAGVLTKDMEFIQFHPTLLYKKEGLPVLVSEAVRGKKAILRNEKGEAFMEFYDERKDLASRDIVSRAIHREIQKQKIPHVYLDATSITDFSASFPFIAKECEKINIYPNKDYIPVIPAAHYLCGGIEVNEYGETSLKGLYACGECSYTGLHGANRLASNSLLEAFVFAYRCFEHAQKYLSTHLSICYEEDPAELEARELNEAELVRISELRENLQKQTTKHLNIVKNTPSLENLNTFIHTKREELNQAFKAYNLSIEYQELRNLLDIAQLTTSQSLARKENRGVFYNLSLENQ